MDWGRRQFVALCSKVVSKDCHALLTIMITLGMAPKLCSAPQHSSLWDTTYMCNMHYSTLLAAQTSIDLVRHQTLFVSLLSVATFKKLLCIGFSLMTESLDRSLASWPSLFYNWDNCVESWLPYCLGWDKYCHPQVWAHKNRPKTLGMEAQHLSIQPWILVIGTAV